MPKGDFMTPKAIGNRMKSVGLQRLRWYCQMCEKQCRDENGFKCHTSSENHLRQMKLFSERSGTIIDGFSSDFESGFIDTLSHLHGTKRVLANKVYQEYIQDKHHIHMNSTMWTSLTGFLMYLGREGKAVVDETERGWFVQFIDRDPKALARQQMRDQRDQSDLDDQQRSDRLIRAQIEAAEARRLLEGEVDNDNDDTNGPADSTEGFKNQPVEVAWKTVETKKRKINAFQTEEDEEDDKNANRSNNVAAAAGKSSFAMSSSSSSSYNDSIERSRGGGSQLEKLMREEESRKQWRIEQDDRKERRDHWLHVGLVVKIMNEKVGSGKYYKRKGEVLRVIDTYVAEVSVDGAILRIDQEQLETVIPKEGELVMVVNGRGRGLFAKLLRIHESKYCCDIRIKRTQGEVTGGSPGHASAAQFYSDMELKNIEYEDVCKIV